MGKAENNETNSLELNLINKTGMNAAHKVYKEICLDTPLSYHELYKRMNSDMRLDYQDLIKKRSFLTTLLNYHINELTHTNPVLIDYLDKSEKAALKEKLIFTFYLLRAQALIDNVEHRHTARDRNYNADKLDAYSNDCYEYIKKIEQNGYSKPMLIVQNTINKSDTYTGVTKFVNGKMTELNSIRLYWVWCSSMLADLINLLPDDFFNKLQGQRGVSAPAPITGAISWLLYYARFCVNFGLLLKHTIDGSWMDKVEGDVSITERFNTQWQQRKFTLLNDFIWASANLLCFFWLKGAGVLGYTGNIVTGGLLLMDLTLTVWRIYEETAKYNHEISLIEHALADLNCELKEAMFQKDIALITSIEHQIKEKTKLKNTLVFDRKFSKISSLNDLAYAASLLIAFSLMCCFFFPPAFIAPATIMILALAGALLSFTLTLIYSAVANGIKIDKSKKLSLQADDESCSLLETFNHNDDDERTQKCLYLQMQALVNESDFHQRQARFQTVKLVQSILVDTLIPAVIFASLVLMPLGIGLGTLAGGLVLIMLTNAVINRFEPKAVALPNFVESDFITTKALPKTERLDHIKTVAAVKRCSFFSIDAKNDPNIDSHEQTALKITQQNG